MKNFLTTLKLIHGSLILGLLIFCGFAYWRNAGLETTSDLVSIFIYIVPLAATVVYFASTYIFQNTVQNINQNKSIQHKISIYQKALIIKYALLEAPTLLALLAYYLTGNALHLVIALCIIAYFISQRPTAEKLRTDLHLNREEQKELSL